MKRVTPIVLSMAGCAMLLAQVTNPGASKKPRISGMPEDVSNRIVAAQKNILLQMRQAKAAAGKDPAAVEKTQAAVVAAQQQAAALVKRIAPRASTNAAADAAEMAALVASASALDAQVEPLSTMASGLETGLIFASMLLGVISSALASFNWNRSSAAVSVLVVVASGIPNLYPIHQRAVYYQTMVNQTRSLTSALALSPELTVAEYDNDVRKEAVLEKWILFPGTDGGDPTEGLLDALDAAKIPAAVGQD